VLRDGLYFCALQPRSTAWPEAAVYPYLFRHICSISSPKKGLIPLSAEPAFTSTRKPARKFASKIPKIPSIEDHCADVNHQTIQSAVQRSLVSLALHPLPHSSCGK
jgi:hypothetical protein